MRPVKISLAGEYVDKLKPGVLLVERELHGSLKGITQKSKIVEPGQGQGQQVVGGCRKFVSRREKKLCYLPLTSLLSLKNQLISQSCF